MISRNGENDVDFFIFNLKLNYIFNYFLIIKNTPL